MARLSCDRTKELLPGARQARSVDDGNRSL